MNRRSWLKTLVGSVAATVLPTPIVVISPVAAAPVEAAKGYIRRSVYEKKFQEDIIAMLTRNMLLDIQAEEDRHFIQHVLHCKHNPDTSMRPETGLCTTP